MRLDPTKDKHVLSRLFGSATEEHSALNIFLDVDGVFADFDGAIQKYAKMKYTDNPEKVWNILDKVPNLFANLDILPGSKELFDDIFNCHSNVVMLTALPQLTNKLVTAPTDKEQWVSANLHSYIDTICVRNWSEKKKYCHGLNYILIDDSARNVDEWRAKGGRAILHTSNESTRERCYEYGIL